MADSTVTWKGAVPFDSMIGQAERVGARSAVLDPRTIASKFTAVPFHSENHESAMKGAIPYISSNDEVMEEGK